MSNHLLIEPEEVHRMLEEKEIFFLIDVREKEEWDAGHIQGALLMPMHTLAEKLEGMPKTAKIVLYCEHGVRSLSATIALERAGYSDVKSMNGGFSAWKNLY